MDNNNAYIQKENTFWNRQKLSDTITPLLKCCWRKTRTSLTRTGKSPH